MGLGVKSETEAFLLSALLLVNPTPPQVSQKAETGIKDGLSVLTSRFYIPELYELILFIFLYISALSQPSTLCPSNLLLISPSRSFVRMLVI